MKYCEDLMLYASNELEGGRKAEFEKHLAQCAACRAELALIRRADESLAPAAAPAHVVDALFAKTTRRKSFFAGWNWKPALAGTALLGVGLFVVLAGLHPDKAAFDATEVIAYMSENLDEEYLNFANDLALFEQEF